MEQLLQEGLAALGLPRDGIPAEDDGISLTREMIRLFAEGNEPK